jgi:hypothetical protein
MVYRRHTARRLHLERDRCYECKRFIRTVSIGRRDWCFERRPAAVALRLGDHRVEYPTGGPRFNAGRFAKGAGREPEQDPVT